MSDRISVEKLRGHKGYAEHAAPENIKARLDEAIAAERKIHLEIMWLTGLLVTRSRQVAAGEWPPRAES